MAYLSEQRIAKDMDVLPNAQLAELTGSHLVRNFEASGWNQPVVIDLQVQFGICVPTLPRNMVAPDITP